MEPITMVISALAAGALAGLKPTAEQAVKDAYAGLKELICRKWRKIDIALLESDPSSKPRQAVLRDELATTSCATDDEVLQRARILVEALTKHAPQALQAVGVKLEEIDVGGSVRLGQIVAQACGVDIKKAKIAHDLEITGVRAGSAPARDSTENP